MTEAEAEFRDLLIQFSRCKIFHFLFFLAFLFLTHTGVSPVVQGIWLSWAQLGLLAVCRVGKSKYCISHPFKESHVSLPDVLSLERMNVPP